jgi:DNA-binding NtrC family response regulator
MSPPVPKEGTTFTVYLPRSGEVVDVSAEEPATPPRGERQHILVVDDEESLLTLVCETLEDLGYVPIGFTSGIEAIAAFRADPKQFDLVISDERMPGLPGSTLIQEMRRIRRAIPILLVSGYLGGMVTSRAYNAGAAEVLKKPISAGELPQPLRACCLPATRRVEPLRHQMTQIGRGPTHAN